MRSATARTLKRLRIVSEALFLGLFLAVYLRSLDPFAALENPFLRYDPLVFLTNPLVSVPALAVIASLVGSALFLGRFFCGWICPLGAVIEALDFLLSPLRRLNPLRRRGGARRRASAAAGAFPALVRFPPALLLLGIALVAAFGPAPILQFLHPNVWLLRVVSLSALGLAFLAFLAVLSLLERRIWCTYLCPLGALYGLLARASPLGLGIESCSSCGRCDRCPTRAVDYRFRAILAQQCILCFDYEHRCPVEGFRYGRRGRARPTCTQPARARRRAEAPWPEAGRIPAGALPAGPPISRRQFLIVSGQLAGGAAAGLLLSGWEARVPARLLRPPGVRLERRFLSDCLRCLQCVRSCPNRIIKITSAEGGLNSVFTPHLSFRPYGCDYFCQVCQQVCPNHAIPLQSLQEKQLTPIGQARIDEQHCVVYKDKVNCLVCEEVCPVPGKAISYTVRPHPGAGEPLKEPKMVAERCIGCGICEAKCPAETLAIRVYPG